jgi:hypothetical protein
LSSNYGSAPCSCLLASRLPLSSCRLGGIVDGRRSKTFGRVISKGFIVISSFWGSFLHMYEFSWALNVYVACSFSIPNETSKRVRARARVILRLHFLNLVITHTKII